MESEVGPVQTKLLYKRIRTNVRLRNLYIMNKNRNRMS